LNSRQGHCSDTGLVRHVQESTAWELLCLVERALPRLWLDALAAGFCGCWLVVLKQSAQVMKRRKKMGNESTKQTCSKFHCQSGVLYWGELNNVAAAVHAVSVSKIDEFDGVVTEVLAGFNLFGRVSSCASSRSRPQLVAPFCNGRGSGERALCVANGLCRWVLTFAWAFAISLDPAALLCWRTPRRRGCTRC
jgi:hypothetical protein